MKTLSKILLLLLVFSITGCAQKRTPVSSDASPVKPVEIIHGPNGELTTENILQNRDISLYDQGGSISCLEWNPDKDLRTICDEKKVRDFLWAHWSEKRRGYIRIVYNSVDWWGTAHIFVEPKEKDAWHIAWRMVGVSALPGGHSRIDDIPDLNSVERIENKKGGSDGWRIVIKKVTGEIFRQFPESK